MHMTFHDVQPRSELNQILEDLRTQHSILVLDFIVHLSHYMFRPRLAAILRWFINCLEYIFCVYEPPEDGHQTGPKHVV
jgi:hypothetical protein